MGIVQIHTNRAVQGIAECKRALELDRNSAMSHGFIGLAKLATGYGEETEAHIHEALRLSPRDAYAYLWMFFGGCANLYFGRDEQAVVWLRRAVETNPNFPLSHFLLAAALARVGTRHEARSAVRAGLALDPTFTIARFRSGAATDNPTYLSQREYACKGMREAGVPEG
jgi:Flp pilus assembly protein TadD